MTARKEPADQADEVVMHCDGACRGNPGLGAWAAVLVWRERRKEIFGVAEQTTNNRMELESAIRGLELLQRPCRVHVVTDSRYVLQGMTEWLDGWKRRGWKKANKEAVLNRELWARLDELASRHEVTWEWVRGHSGHELNERCDELCNRAMDEYLASREAKGR